MEALKRTPKIEKASFDLDSETKIDYIGISVRKIRDITNNKTLSDFDKGINATAAKIRVNGNTVVADDLYDGFSDSELMKIMEFISSVEGTNENPL